MAADAFNSLGGLTVGIPAVAVVNAAGTVVANVNSQNIIAANIFTDGLHHANGLLYETGAFGSNNEIQYNSSDNFASSPNFTYNPMTNTLVTPNLVLQDASNLSLGGGTTGYYLQTDGLGHLGWAYAGSGGTGAPGGANTHVQFNNTGLFEGNTNFTYHTGSSTLFVPNVVANLFTGSLNGTATAANTAGTVLSSAQPNITSTGTLTSLAVSGNVYATLYVGSGANLTNLPAANIIGSIPLTAQVSDAIQSNITTLGTLTSISATGMISTTNNITANNVTAARTISASSFSASHDITLSGNLTINNTGNLRVYGNADLTSADSVSFGQLETIHVQGGESGFFIQTDGTGNLTWSAPPGGGGGGPPAGGANTQIQYNDSGTSNGNPALTFNEVTSTLNVRGNLVANTFQMGSGVYKFCTTTVDFQTTSSTAPNQSLWSAPLTNISAVDFSIVASTLGEPTGATRQTSKISALVLDGIVQYTEYAGLHINGGVGTFTVVKVPGDIYNPDTVHLQISPDSAYLTDYKMMIVEYTL
jgi:hypothetical protein